MPAPNRPLVSRNAYRFASSLRRQSKKAFTLVELLAVTTLVGLAVGIVTLRLDSFSEAGRLQAAARQIGTLIHLAQTDARTSGRSVILRYEIGEPTIAVLRPMIEQDRVIWVRRPGIELAGSVTIVGVAGTSLNEKPDADLDHVDVRMPAHGVFGSHRVGLALSENRQVEIHVDGITGNVKIIEEHEHDAEMSP